MADRNEATGARRRNVSAENSFRWMSRAKQAALKPRKLSAHWTFGECRRHRHVGTLLGTNSVDLDKLYAVNVRGVFNCCKAFAPAMLERKSGSVINMASIGGIVAVRERWPTRQPNLRSSA